MLRQRVVQPLRVPGCGIRVLRLRDLQGLDLLVMLVGRVAHHFLHEEEALSDCGVLLVSRLQRRQLLLVAAVGLPELLQLPRMLVRRLAEQLLEVLQALAHRGVLRMERLQGVEVLGLLAVPERKLRVSLAQRLEFLRVLVGRIAQQLLEEDHPLRQGGMMVVSFLQVRDIACVLVVRGLQCFQLLGVLVGGVGKSLLQVRHALRQGRVPARHARQLLRMLVMCSPEGLHIHGVLICRISQELLNVSNPVLGRGVVRGRVGDVLGVLGEGRGVLRVHHSKLLDLPRVLVCGVVEELLQVAEPLGDRGVVLMRGLQTRELLEVVVVCISQGLQLLRMLARGIPEKLLHVTQALPE
mmetsp:Transcript_62720/g.164492  ORF Transcript_62720/g.164492 Transcript_62720/m.164492 type:complete len:354 (-) Transcript_62720:1224-2285(-)